MAFYSNPYKIYREKEKIDHKIHVKRVLDVRDSVKNILATPVKFFLKQTKNSIDNYNTEYVDKKIKTDFIRVKKMSEFEKFYNNPDSQ